MFPNKGRQHCSTKEKKAGWRQSEGIWEFSVSSRMTFCLYAPIPISRISLFSNMSYLYNNKLLRSYKLLVLCFGHSQDQTPRLIFTVAALQETMVI